MIKRLLSTLVVLFGLSMAAGSLLLAPAASAQGNNNPVYGTVPATSSTTDPCGASGNAATAASCSQQTPAVTTQTASQQSPANAGSGLAFTGTDVIETVVIAFALIGVGLVVLRANRRRHTS